MDRRTLFLSFAVLRDLGWSSTRSLLRKLLVKDHLRTNSGTFAIAPHLAQRPYWIEECFGVGVMGVGVSVRFERLS